MAEYSICNCIRTDKPVKRNGKYPVYLRVRVGARGTKFPTDIDVWKDRWDERNKRPKDKPLLIRLNKKILELDLYINRALVNGQELTLELVKDFYSGKRKERPEDTSFYTYYLDFIDRKRKEGLNPETIRVYMTTYNVMKEFRKEFLISDMSLKLIENFDMHMRTVNKNSAGGRSPKHKNLRTVVLDIQKHNIPIDNPYRFFKMPTAQTREVYLDKAELMTFISRCNSFCKTSKEYQIMKMYEFSCYTGLRFSDAMDLRWADVDFENGIIQKTMIKTKSDVITPLFPLAKEILLEWSKGGTLIGSNLKIFHRYSEPTINKTLRKQSLLAGINKRITYHSSRHTFATLLVIDGVDIYKIQKYLGHKSVNMTERYLKYDLSIAKESAKEINTFSGNSI